MRKRKVLTAFLLALVFVAAACGGDSEDDGGASEESERDQEEVSETYSGHGVTFDYPAGWEEFPAKSSATTAGSNELWSATVGPDQTNLVSLTAYQLNVAITDENLDDVESELDDVIQNVVDQAGGQIIDGPTASEVAGFPAYTYEWEGVEVDGEPKDSSAYFLFDGDIEYFFNCQFSDDVADEVQAGCDQILDSFSVTEST